MLGNSQPTLIRALNTNQLNGTIPVTIGQLLSLQQLWDLVVLLCRLNAFFFFAHRQLYGNPLTGTIPSSIGLLKMLNSMCVTGFVCNFPPYRPIRQGDIQHSADRRDACVHRPDDFASTFVRCVPIIPWLLISHVPALSQVDV